MGELRVALDQRDRAGKPLLAQIVGDRAADDCSADDDDIVPRHVFRSSVRPILQHDSFTSLHGEGLQGPACAGQEDQMLDSSRSPRRSVLYVPASNNKALAKLAVAGLRCGDLRPGGCGRARGEGRSAREPEGIFWRARARRAGMHYPHQCAGQRMGNGRSACGAGLQAGRHPAAQGRYAARHARCRRHAGRDRCAERACGCGP